MRIRKVRQSGVLSKVTLANGSLTNGHYSTQLDGKTVSITAFFGTEKDDASGALQEFGLTLLVSEIEILAKLAGLGARAND